MAATMTATYDRLSRRNLNAARISRELASYEQSLQGLAACLSAAQDDIDTAAQEHTLAVVKKTLRAAYEGAAEAMRR